MLSSMINRPLPEENVSLVGYAALVDNFALSVPLPEVLAVISSKHKKYETDNWRVFTPRHAPEDSLYGQLVFALKYEGLDLAVLKALFDVIPGGEIETAIKNEPSGMYARKIWFCVTANKIKPRTKMILAHQNIGFFLNMIFPLQNRQFFNCCSEFLCQ